VSSGIRAQRAPTILGWVRSCWRVAWWWLRWHVRYWWVLSAVVAVALVSWRRDAVTFAALAVGLLLAVSTSATVWWSRWPVSYERVCAGPCRRLGWRRWVRRSWPHLAQECGLSVQRTRTQHRLVSAGSGKGVQSERFGVRVWVHPRLAKVTTTGGTVRLLIQTRTGQTVDDLERAVPALAAAAGAVSSKTRLVSSSRLEITLVMHEVLATALAGAMPEPAPVGRPAQSAVESVLMGLRQDGTPWRLTLMGRHTLVVGCSGSGKGSMLWGVCGGLAPAVAAGLVQLWGLDLKKGVEIEMGRPLFHSTATSATFALPALRRLMTVIDERGHAMAGISRLHQPTVGEPLHVLVVDELADLIAYSDLETKKEANRLLAVILTQGRALGIVVVACVQDPRKETVGMRSLFTQTVALRLRSATETAMVLGDGMAALAPAHRIDPTAKGTAYVIDDDGTVDRVRIAYWPDDLIRAVAQRYPAPQEPEAVTMSVSPAKQGSTPQDAPPRSPQDRPASRKPRARRQDRNTGLSGPSGSSGSSDSIEEGAA